MLPSSRRHRSHLIRLGLGLIGVVSLVAVVVLLPQALNATTPVGERSPLTAPTDIESARTVESASDALASRVADVSPVDYASTVERAQIQLSSLLDTDESIDGTLLLPSDRVAALDTSLASASLASPSVPRTALGGIDDLASIEAIDSAAADWLALTTEASQLAYARGSEFSGGGGGFAGGGGGFVGGGFAGGVSGGSSRAVNAIDADDVAGGLEAPPLSTLPGAASRDSGESAGDFRARSDRDGDRGDRRSDNRPRGDDRDRDGRGPADSPRQGPRGNPNGSPSVGGPGGDNHVSVPEPSSLLLTGLGLVGFASAMRRRMGR